MFEPGPIAGKKITAEACVHHLYFDAGSYEELGSKIKCNPAIKDAHHRAALWQGLLDDRLDVIATDHAPHTMEEKAGTYFNAPAGLPLVQHSANIMLELRQTAGWDLPFMARKMSHAVADCFRIKERGYLREGYYADFYLLDEDAEWTVSKENILFRCGWSPLENHRFKGQVQQTWVNGQQVWDSEKGILSSAGKRLLFN